MDTDCVTDDGPAASGLAAVRLRAAGLGEDHLPDLDVAGAQGLGA